MCPTTIIGVDCAVESTRTGYAIGHLAKRKTVVTEVGTGRGVESLCASLASRVEGRTLFALDAPLGWPRALGSQLQRHLAGVPLTEGDAHVLFRRGTDRFVRSRLGLQPLDVGADRIARTAHAALQFLRCLRQELGADIPLAWSPDFQDDIAAIEVYPAGTLTANGIRSRGYKKKGSREARCEIVQFLRGQETFEIAEDISRLEENHDALDATVCILAAMDFLAGKAMPPPDLATAKKEGWIWVLDPGDCIERPRQ